ncbi:MAG: glutamyl-tRNA reductase [Cytophagales bacterium]|nr:glutamyl-tRNA reductase [Cytophagales bacterium]
MHQTFRALGISYKSAPVDLREQVTLEEESNRKFLKVLSDTLGLGEAIIISTCNRTEIYYSAEGNRDEEILSLLSVEKDLFQFQDFRSHFKSYTGDAAINHLYRVSLGLESKVLGDIQISNQVKKAYQYSADEGMAGPFLHRLMHAIFYANKRVVQETAFRDGTASTSYAAVELVKQVIPNFEQPKVLLLGLGEIGENIAENLEGIEAAIYLANRTLSKAETLASRLGYHTLSLEAALANVSDFDAIISTVAVDDPIITKGHLDSELSGQKLVIDLSVPRSVAPEVDELPHVLLYNVDQIEEKTTQTVQERKNAIPAVEQILVDSVDEFHNWAQEMEVSPTIQKLKNALEEIRQKEISKYVKKASESELKLLDSATKGIIQKVMRLPVLQLKAACKRGEAETLVESLNDLFNLEQEEVTKS